MSIYPSKDEVTSMKPVFCTCYTSLGKHAHLFAKRNYLYKNVKVLGKWRSYVVLLQDNLCLRE